MIKIALIFALRIFGFMAVLPVITSAAISYNDYSIAMVGVAIGAYGLAQAALHIPMGYLSDKIGRKKTVLIGLTLMLIGSIIAANTNSIYGLIFGRVVQGFGAIGSVLNAWCADLTPAKDLTKAMALIGITIGATFLLAIVLGPIIATKFHLTGLFIITAILSILAMLLALTLPEPNNLSQSKFCQHVKAVLSDKKLLQLDYGVFMLHASYTALFLLIPAWVSSYSDHAWHIYAPSVAIAVLIALPAMFFAEAKGLLRQILITAAVVLCLASLLFFSQHWLIALVMYFAAFTTMEALLPSLLAKASPANCKGTVMGVFSCAQYLGIFLGGALGGMLLHISPQILLSFVLLLSVIWLISLR